MESKFVTFEQALILKSLGFDEPCISYFTVFGRFANDFSSPRKYNSEFENGSYVSSPMRSQVFDFFRNEHKIYPEIRTDCTTYPKFCFTYSRFFGNPKDLTEQEWWWENTIGVYSELYRNYEEAESACIDKMIEIVKSKVK